MYFERSRYAVARAAARAAGLEPANAENYARVLGSRGTRNGGCPTMSTQSAHIGKIPFLTQMSTFSEFLAGWRMFFDP